MRMATGRRRAEITTEQVHTVIRALEWSKLQSYEDWNGTLCQRECCPVCNGAKPGIDPFKLYGLEPEQIGHGKDCVYLEIGE